MANYNLEGPKWGPAGYGSAGGTITWAVDATVPGSFVPVLTAAFADWSSHANIQFKQVSSTAQSQIDVTLVSIDGASNVLGYASYNYSGSSLTSVSIEFDKDEGWHSTGSSVVSNTGTSLFVVALHEIGHAIGLDHYNATPAVMNAYLDPSVTDLARSDIDGALALYGAAAPTPKSVDASLFGTVAHDVHSSAGKVYALYEGLLNRAPDPLGGEDWAAALDHGASLAYVTRGFLDSAEGRTHINAADNAGFVEQLYQTVLGRHGDAAGAQAWVAALEHGTSRVDVADAFVFSAEHVAQLQPALDAGVFVADATETAVARLYYGIFDRAPDAGGLHAWETAAHSGTSLSAIADAFLSSSEYRTAHTSGVTSRQFVDILYLNALGRPADSAGEQSWVQALDAGHLTRGQVAVGIAESSEAQQHLASSIEQGWHLA